MSIKNDIPQKQRALVLQGGGALGAYEAGAISVLCQFLSDEDKRKNENQRNGRLFDIIAGSSIGAMNAAVLVSNVVNREKSWKEAAEILEHFWTDEAKGDEKKGGLSSTPDISKWLVDEQKKPKNFNASPEAVRKYYSVKEYVMSRGAPNVYPPPTLECDSKFADPGNRWLVHDSSPLQNTIERYSQDRKDENNAKMRIATSWDNREPRLLVISVNVAEGKTEAFDSYHTNAEEDPKNSLYEGNGIIIDHVMASGTLPEFYKFREIPPEGGRKFCDGGILSNTPFRELLRAHRDYWKRAVGEDKDKIPDLDVYIINVHPSKQDEVPTDLDGVRDRINDITFSDRNSYNDEMVADLISDYTELIDRLKELAKSHFANRDESNTIFQNEFENLLNSTEAKSKGDRGEHIKYKDLLKGRFKLTKVIRIEPAIYSNSIFGKGGDFTSKTITSLIEQGKQDTRRVLGVQEKT
jgi:predicted acylesterase/phospholipase RssA